MRDEGWAAVPKLALETLHRNPSRIPHPGTDDYSVLQFLGSPVSKPRLNEADLCAADP